MTFGSRRMASGDPSAILTAEVEHDDLVAHVHDEVHVVLDEEDGHAPVVGEAAHEVGQLGALGVAEAGRRLVQQQHARLGGDGVGDGQQPTLAVGEVLDGPPEVVLDLELADRCHDLAGQRWIDRVHEVADVGPAVARVGRGAQVVEHGRVLEQLERLERARQPDAGALRRGHAVERDAVEVDVAGAARREPGDGVDGRGLAGAVGPDQPGDLARPHGQRQVVDRGDAAVAHGEVVHLEHLRRDPLPAFRRQLDRAGGAGVRALRNTPRILVPIHFSWAADSLAMPSWFCSTRRITMAPPMTVRYFEAGEDGVGDAGADRARGHRRPDERAHQVADARRRTRTRRPSPTGSS